MKLREFLLNLENAIEEHSDILNYEVIYSIDDEGNKFHRVLFKPTLGFYDNDLGEFDDDHYLNAVCIN